MPAKAGQQTQGIGKAKQRLKLLLIFCDWKINKGTMSLNLRERSLSQSVFEVWFSIFYGGLLISFT